MHRINSDVASTSSQVIRTSIPSSENFLSILFWKIGGQANQSENGVMILFESKFSDKYFRVITGGGWNYNKEGHDDI